MEGEDTNMARQTIDTRLPPEYLKNCEEIAERLLRETRESERAHKAHITLMALFESIEKGHSTPKQKETPKIKKRLSLTPFEIESILFQARKNDEFASTIQYGITSYQPASAEIDETAMANSKYRRTH